MHTKSFTNFELSQNMDQLRSKNQKMQLINQRLKIENHSANLIYAPGTIEKQSLNEEAVNEQTFFSKEQLNDNIEMAEKQWHSGGEEMERLKSELEKQTQSAKVVKQQQKQLLRLLQEKDKSIDSLQKGARMFAKLARFGAMEARGKAGGGRVATIGWAFD